MKVCIVDTGAANLASVEAALERAGAKVQRSTSAVELSAAPAVVLPGVGSFGAGMERLGQLGLAEVLAERVRSGRATLCICLGMQLLGTASEESDGSVGLSALPVRAVRLGPKGPVPHLGWSPIACDLDCQILEDGYAAFAHSYAIPSAPARWRAAHCPVGGGFVAALERGAVVATQFHPELSGALGARLIDRWLAVARGQSPGGRPTGASVPQADLRPGPAVRLVPCLDVRDGRLVKGVRFLDLEELGDPLEVAVRYAEGGADELCLLDVEATPSGLGPRGQWIRRVRAQVAIPLVVGGGVRSISDAALLLEHGADKVALNSAAARDPGCIDALARRYGSQSVVLALDARRNPRMASGYEHVAQSGRLPTGRDGIDFAREACARGAGEILATSVDRDGTQAGFELDLLSRLRASVDVPIVASGGAGSAKDLAAAARAGANALLAASLFHKNQSSVAQMKRELRDLGVPIRPIERSVP